MQWILLWLQKILELACLAWKMYAFDTHKIFRSLLPYRDFQEKIRTVQAYLNAYNA